MGLFCAHALHMLAAKSGARVVRVGPAGLPATLGDMAALPADRAQHLVLWAALNTTAFALSLPLAIGVGVLLSWHVYIMLAVRVGPRVGDGQVAGDAVAAQAHFVERRLLAALCAHPAPQSVTPHRQISEQDHD